MFHRTVENPPELAQDVDPAPAPVSEKVPTHRARIFQPSSFASRKAQAEANNAERAVPRLVSLGPTERWMRDRNNQQIMVEGELFCDVDNPMRTWVKLEGYTNLEPLFDLGDGKSDKAEALGTIKRDARFAGRFEPSMQDDPAPRDVRAI